MKVDGLRVRGCDVLLLETIELVELGPEGCLNITDECMMEVVPQCRKLASLDISRGESLTDAGITALGAGCGKLQSINLAGCDKALGAGCGKLRSINLERCKNVTDAGVKALSAGCGKLQNINLWGCNKVTDAGVIVLGAGCVQLQSIYISVEYRMCSAAEHQSWSL